MKSLTLSEAISFLKIKKKTLILCHKNPDPDTIGSAVALSLLLKELGSESDIACSDNLGSRFDVIIKNREILTKVCAKDYKKIIAVDVAAPVQLGDFVNLADKVDLVIDHHRMSTRFGNYYEDFLPACAEIIYEMSQELGLFDKMPLDFYDAVYAGLSGDTGCFKYSNTTPKSLMVASKLLEKGIDHAEINRCLFDSKTVGEITAQRVTYENMQLFCYSRLSMVMITNEIKAKNDLKDEDITDIVNVIREIKGVDVAVSIKQSDKDETKFSISARSNIDINVSDVCATLGGGGHPRAAGATIVSDDPKEVFEQIKELFSEEIEKFYAKK